MKLFSDMFMPRDDIHLMQNWVGRCIKLIMDWRSSVDS